MFSTKVLVFLTYIIWVLGAKESKFAAKIKNARDPASLLPLLSGISSVNSKDWCPQAREIITIICKADDDVKSLDSTQKIVAFICQDNFQEALKVAFYSLTFCEANTAVDEFWLFSFVSKNEEKGKPQEIRKMVKNYLKSSLGEGSFFKFAKHEFAIDGPFFSVLNDASSDEIERYMKLETGKGRSIFSFPFDKKCSFQDLEEFLVLKYGAQKNGFSSQKFSEAPTLEEEAMVAITKEFEESFTLAANQREISQVQNVQKCSLLFNNMPENTLLGRIYSGILRGERPITSELQELLATKFNMYAYHALSIMLKSASLEIIQIEHEQKKVKSLKEISDIIVIYKQLWNKNPIYRRLNANDYANVLMAAKFSSIVRALMIEVIEEIDMKVLKQLLNKDKIFLMDRIISENSKSNINVEITQVERSAGEIIWKEWGFLIGYLKVELSLMSHNSIALSPILASLIIGSLKPMNHLKNSLSFFDGEYTKTIHGLLSKMLNWIRKDEEMEDEMILFVSWIGDKRKCPDLSAEFGDAKSKEMPMAFSLDSLYDVYCGVPFNGDQPEEHLYPLTATFNYLIGGIRAATAATNINDSKLIEMRAKLREQGFIFYADVMIPLYWDELPKVADEYIRGFNIMYFKSLIGIYYACKWINMKPRMDLKLRESVYGAAWNFLSLKKSEKFFKRFRNEYIYIIDTFGYAHPKFLDAVLLNMPTFIIIETVSYNQLLRSEPNYRDPMIISMVRRTGDSKQKLKLLMQLTEDLGKEKLNSILETFYGAHKSENTTPKVVKVDQVSLEAPALKLHAKDVAKKEKEKEELRNEIKGLMDLVDIDEVNAEEPQSQNDEPQKLIKPIKFIKADDSINDADIQKAMKIIELNFDKKGKFPWEKIVGFHHATVYRLKVRINKTFANRLFFSMDVKERIVYLLHFEPRKSAYLELIDNLKRAFKKIQKNNQKFKIE